jgi:hypothetical protein
MIIRRKHTANFTTIGNGLFKDERLAADEVGVIATLLSMPNDWEVRRPALQRRWKIGRDSIKRIIHSAMRTGWIVAQKTRLANGTFHIVYEVRDEPGPALSDEEIKAALSVVSTGAGHDDSDDDEGQGGSEHDAQGAESTHPPPTENPSWSAGQPGVAEPSTANPSRPSKTLQNTDPQRTESTNRARAYADLRQGWPPENVLSDVAAERAFLDLADVDKQAAVNGRKPYLDDCQSQSRKVCDLTTYIREKRWQRFATKAPSGPIELIKAGTPEWFRWQEYYTAVSDNENFNLMQSREKRSLPHVTASRWPPAMPKKSDNAA